MWEVVVVLDRGYEAGIFQYCSDFINILVPRGVLE